MRIIVFWLAAIALTTSLSAQDDFHLYLIGDAGETYVNNVPYKELLQSKLRTDHGGKAVIFLGDNVYPKGMPGRSEKGRQRAEGILREQIALAQSAGVAIYFIPGNHDWNAGHKDGWKYIRNQQEWIDSLNDDRIKFFPKDGCPGPVEIQLSANLTLIIIDTQWPLHTKDKPVGVTSNCTSKSSGDIIAALDEMLRRNQGKRVVVVGHHPVYTVGEHGGVFTWRDHIFPLSQAVPGLYIPLPIIGSLYPLYRKNIGAAQDLSHPVYKEFAASLTKVMAKYPGTIYATGHEHALEYSYVNGVHHIVSGAGVKTTAVKLKPPARFAVSTVGFTEIRLSAPGDGSIDYYSGATKAHSESIALPVRP